MTSAANGTRHHNPSHSHRPQSAQPSQRCAERCSVCGVTIDGDDRVRFAFGPSGSRDRLYARVCQFSSEAGCINQRDSIGRIDAADCYGNPQEAQAHLRGLRQKLKQRTPAAPVQGRRWSA